MSHLCAVDELTDEGPSRAADNDGDDVEYVYSDDEDGDNFADNPGERATWTRAPADTSSPTDFVHSIAVTHIEKDDPRCLEPPEDHCEHHVGEDQLPTPRPHMCVEYFLRVTTVFAREGGFSADAWPLLSLCRDTWECTEVRLRWPGCVLAQLFT